MLTVRLKKLGLKPGDLVLDLGCGEGRHVHGVYMEGGVNVVGLDIDLPSLKNAREGLDYLDDLNGKPETKSLTAFVRGSAYQLPFADNTFDAIICSEVLEHLDAYPDVIDEIRRVLKPQGMLAATIPHAWPERICWKLAPPPNGYPFEPGGHIRIFDDIHLKYEFVHHGFSFLHKHHAHGLHAPYWWLKCAFWSRRDDHPLVKAYHSLLVWDLMKRPWLTRFLEALTAPVMGKSVAMYFKATDK